MTDEAGRSRVSVPSAAYREAHLLPSILSADFSRLGEEIARVMDAGARIIHCDIMDGHFVPNLTIGPAVVAAIAPHVHSRGGLLSVHLMIEKPETFFDEFAGAGADVLSVHVEACPQLYHAIGAIKALGLGAGVAINPGTHVSAIRDVAELVDLALVMTVNPGFGGQKLITSALNKVPVVRRMIRPDAAVELDGGVNRGNIRQVVEMGANWVVAGSAVFGTPDPGEEVRVLRSLMGPVASD
jgi:ribulose-phosphate 3-epimerase